MFKKLTRILQYFKLKEQNEQTDYHNLEGEAKIPGSIKFVKKQLKLIFADSSDFVIREIKLGQDSKQEIIIAFLDGLVDNTRINDNILRPIMNEARKAELDKELKPETVVSILSENLISISDVEQISSFKKSVNLILTGDTLIYIDGVQTALKTGTRGWQSRAIEEPDTESVVRGPREAFNETLRTNTALLRRKIKNANLKLETFTLGEQTNTDVAICYIKGLAHEDIVDTVRRRLKRIKIDAVLETGYLEEFIEDAPLSIFPTVGNSEKPDVVAGKILEGRVAIFCDGTPFVLIVPHLFIESLHSSEDYYTSYTFSTLNRVLRTLSLFTTTTLPAFYVALVNFHQESIPLKLLLTIAATREGIPFSAFTETVLMGVTFEVLREAGVRMPRPIGQAVSIVGALVLGQAAVEAGVASNPVVMVTAITAIAGFVIPSLRGTLPIIRFLLIIGANAMGLMGMFTIILLFFVHLCNLRSFGVPYLSPIAPLSGLELNQDTFVRIPLWAMWKRPSTLLRKEYRKEYQEQEYRMEADLRTRED